jgi:hypothetical protein
VVIAGVIGAGCHHRKKPKGPRADEQAYDAVSVGWDDDGFITVANSGLDSVLVAVGIEPPSDGGAIEIPVEPAETVVIPLDEDEVLWRFDGEAWLELSPDA